MTKLKTIKTRVERLLAIGKGDKKAARDVLAMAKAKGAAGESQRPDPEPEKTEPMDMVGNSAALFMVGWIYVSKVIYPF